MRRSLGMLATLALAAPLLSTGCGGTGSETAAPAAATADSGGTPSKDDALKPKGEAELVTPNQVVDPKSLIDVVKEEVKGANPSSGRLR
jgi:hypothetical protein